MNEGGWDQGKGVPRALRLDAHLPMVGEINLVQSLHFDWSEAKSTRIRRRSNPSMPEAYPAILEVVSDVAFARAVAVGSSGVGATRGSLRGL
jgi:hypothetical protein